MIPIWFEVTSLAVLLVILVVDLLLILKRPHVPSMREASIWVLVYVTAALIFAGLLVWVGNVQVASEFVAGWLTEYSLSIDNLFVFVLILGAFKVPLAYQQRALMVGIVIALIFRAVFIILGAAVIERFGWVFYIFGAWLIWTAWQQIKPEHDDAEIKDGLLVRVVKKTLPYSDEYDAGRMITKIDGKRFITPLLMVYLALGSTDLLFALDSIPAIFGITKDPFIVFATNLFALMGLRQLYFLLGGLLEKLVYLKYGIAAILAFIGIKLVLHALGHNNLPFIAGGESVAWAPDIPIWLSLLVIVAAMAIATGASLYRVYRDSKKTGKRVHLGAHEDSKD